MKLPFTELEALLLTHPKIKDCGVIGKPDESAGELPLAFVVREDDSLTAADIVKFVAENASYAKRLHGGVKFVDEIPKNPSGKILRRELRELLKKFDVKAKL
jgi:4-coumarate--CoA ligase